MNFPVPYPPTIMRGGDREILIVVDEKIYTYVVTG
jgi:hypothetical protein